MESAQILNAFISLGKRLKALSNDEKDALYQETASRNNWFTPKQIDLALTGISHFLETSNILSWAKQYQTSSTSRKVGVIMAGNIPMVGFHDLLCVLVSGHYLVAKLSTQDTVLMQFIIRELMIFEPRLSQRITFTERMNEVEALIATGSDNSARHFEYYFRNIPHIIRKNRSSCAVLSGTETRAELESLGHDVFSYYGLGCRNVSKLFVPEKFNFPTLLDAWHSFEDLTNHHKYVNNYDYNKSIMLVNGVPFFDTGFVMLTENENLVSPISVVYYESYADRQDLIKKLEVNKDKLQCIVSADTTLTGSIPFGGSQTPDLMDYADGVDTMKFLSAL